jgi:hypothetical protein
MKITYETQPRGTRLSFAGMSKPLAEGVHAWRQRPTGLPSSVIGTGVIGTVIGVSTTDNSRSVSEVEHRHR